jgi:hypothetical protein
VTNASDYLDSLFFVVLVVVPFSPPTAPGFTPPEMPANWRWPLARLASPVTIGHALRLEF